MKYVIFDIIRQNFLQQKRAKGYYKNTFISIMVWIFVLYMASFLLILGFLLDNILEKIHINQNSVEIAGNMFFYLYLGGILIRIVMQQLQRIQIHTYQHLPIRRNTLVNYLIITPILHPFNYLLLFLIIPFAIQAVSVYYSVDVAIRFVCCMVFMIWFNYLTAGYFKRKLPSEWIGFVILLLVIIAFVCMEFLGWFSLCKISRICMLWLITHSYGIFIPIAMVVIAYIYNFQYFNQHYYIETFNTKKADKVKTYRLSFLDRFGLIGEIMGMEIKLLLRHKRTKSMLFVLPFSLLLGLLYYIDPKYAENPGWLFFGATYIIGMLMFIFRQSIISWDSSHFDGLMSNNISIENYLKANLYIMQITNIICFILSSPYFIIGWHIVAYHVTVCLFNMGVLAYIFLFFACYNAKHIDLKNNSAYNYQGFSFKNLLIINIPLFLPIIIISILHIWLNTYVILGAFSALGIIGLCLQKYWLRLCINKFNQQKYTLLEGFRQSE